MDKHVKNKFLSTPEIFNTTTNKISKRINIDYITKIEGHAKLRLVVENSQLTSVDLDVFTGARYFEALVVGKKYSEIPEITQRVCSICSAVHNVAAVRAIEDALGITSTKQTDALRELLCIGGMLESHALHIFFLALPDYTGHTGAIDMAKKYKKEVLIALKLKRLGNKIVEVIGGREIHQFTNAVGGFKSTPSQERLDELLKEMHEHKKLAITAAKLFSKLKYPRFYRPTHQVCLHSESYPHYSGDLFFEGQIIPVKEYDKHIKETIEYSSVSKEARFDKETYTTNALTRINANHDKLSFDARKIIEESQIQFPTSNPYLNTFAQAIEIVHFIDEAIRILKHLKVQKEERQKIKPKAGRGVCIIEAPRGILIHDYTLDKKGFVKKANIITPTSQNLHNIEMDIKKRVPHILHLSEDEIRHDVEKLIRAYDPCISCSAHFLKIEWKK